MRRFSPLRKKKKKNTIVEDAEALVELLSQCSNAVAVCECGKVLHERGVHVRKSCLTTECPCKFQNERCGEQCSCFHCSNGKQEAKDILVAEKPQETDPRDVQLDMVKQLKNTTFIRSMKSPVFSTLDVVLSEVGRHNTFCRARMYGFLS